MTWCSVIDMDGNVTEGVGVEIKTNSDKASIPNWLKALDLKILTYYPLENLKDFISKEEMEI
jgi:hypothetical protein